MRNIIIVITCVGLMHSCVVDGRTNEAKELNLDSLKCNIEVVVRLSNTLEKPGKTDLLNFLYTFDDICDNNVEYREFSNEVLFQVIQKHPDKVLDLLKNNNVNIRLLLRELSSPISDAYNDVDISETIKKIKKIEESKNE